VVLQLAVSIWLCGLLETQLDYQAELAIRYHLTALSLWRNILMFCSTRIMLCVIDFTRSGLLPRIPRVVFDRWVFHGLISGGSRHGDYSWSARRHFWDMGLIYIHVSRRWLMFPLHGCTGKPYTGTRLCTVAIGMHFAPSDASPHLCHIIQLRWWFSYTLIEHLIWC